MTENQIRVNSFEELISKIKEWVANQRGAEKVSLRDIFEKSGNYTFKNGKSVQTSKGGVGVKLESKNKAQEFFLETDDDPFGQKTSEEFGKSIPIPPRKAEIFSGFYRKIQQELEKIGIFFGRCPSPEFPKPPENKPKPEKNSYSVIARPCSSFYPTEKWNL